MSNEVYRVNPNLPNDTKIEELNEMILYLNGLVAGGKFDKNEIENLYTQTGKDRKFLRDMGIGNTTATYGGWSHLIAEDGYSIWKYSPTTYAYNAVNNLYFDGKLVSNKGLADSETATTYDKVFLYNGSTYIDDTTEAGTEGGTAFSLMAATSNYLYLGYSTPNINGVKFKFQTRGSNYTLKVEYYNGSSGGGDGWHQLTLNHNNFVDNTNSFQSNGRMTWNSVSGDWDTVAVNGVTKYWLRISTTTTPVTTAKAYYIIPGDSVVALLSLSSTEIRDEDWAWCTYGIAIYVTIRNAGNSNYEGDYYISSSSTAANKANFFAYNHPFTADYQDSTYTP